MVSISCHQTLIYECWFYLLDYLKKNVLGLLQWHTVWRTLHENSIPTVYLMGTCACDYKIFNYLRISYNVFWLFYPHAFLSGGIRSWTTAQLSKFCCRAVKQGTPCLLCPHALKCREQCNVTVLFSPWHNSPLPHKTQLLPLRTWGVNTKWKVKSNQMFCLTVYSGFPREIFKANVLKLE